MWTTRSEEIFFKGEGLRTDMIPLKPLNWGKYQKFYNCMIERGYPVPIVKKYLSELKFADSKTALQQSNKSARKKTTTFCYTIPPGFT